VDLRSRWISVLSERAFFSLRYIVPGYVFIFLVLSVNINPLLHFLENSGSPELFGAFLAFASLLAGSAAGFLVSQFWWFRFHQTDGIFGIKEFGGEIRLLERLNLNFPKNEKEKKRAMEAFLDLTVFLEKKDKLLELVWRRWDIYHILSSVRHALWIGLSAGIACRVFNEFSLGYNTLLFDYPIENPENIAFIFSIAVAFVLFLFFGKVREHVVSRYYPLHEAIVRRNLSKNIFALSTAFPELFKERQET